MKKLDEQTDALLQRGLVNTPEDFRDRVMQDIARHERDRHTTSVENESVDLTPVPWWQWAAITIGSLIGGGQVLRFIFSVWFASSAAY